MKKIMKEKNKKRAKIFFLYYLILVIILIMIGYGSYSKYRTIATAESQIDAAKFSFKVANEIQNVTLNLSDTIKANATSNNVIIPGTDGKITLNLDFSEIEVATRYTVTVDETNTKVPENLKLYIDSENKVEFSGYTGMTEVDTTILTRDIYWKWNYTSTDETEQWMGKELKVSLNIIAEQRTN